MRTRRSTQPTQTATRRRTKRHKEDRAHVFRPTVPSFTFPGVLHEQSRRARALPQDVSPCQRCRTSDSRPKSSRALVLAVLIVGCGGGTPSAEPTTPQTETPSDSIVSRLPDSVRQAMTRELDPMPIRKLSFEERSITVSVEAPEEPQWQVIEVEDEDDADVVSLAFAYGGGSFACYVYGDQVDPAATMGQIMQGILGGEGIWYAVERTDAGVIDGRPYLLAETVFRKRDGDRHLWGNLLVAIGRAQFETVACWSDPPGMRETFSRIFQGVLGTINTPLTARHSELVYSTIETTKTRAGGDLASFATTHVYVEKDGTTQHERHVSRVARTEDLHVATRDTIDIRRSTNGRVFYGSFVAADTDSLDYNLELTADEATPSRYAVTGQVMDKPFQASFDVPGGLNDIRKDTREVREFMQSSAARALSIQGYSPSADPSQAIAVLVEKERSADGRFNATTAVGGVTFPVEINPQGEIVAARIKVGGVDMELRQVWSEGSLPP